MRARTAAPAALIASVLLAGCGSEELHGTVTEKEHKPAASSWRTVPETREKCSTSTRRAGKTTRRVRSCKTIQIGTKRVRETKPECWEIELDGDRDVCVDRERFERTEVGDRW